MRTHPRPSTPSWSPGPPRAPLPPPCPAWPRSPPEILQECRSGEFRVVCNGVGGVSAAPRLALLFRRVSFARHHTLMPTDHGIHHHTDRSTPLHPTPLLLNQCMYARTYLKGPALGDGAVLAVRRATKQKRLHLRAAGGVGVAHVGVELGGPRAEAGWVGGWFVWECVVVSTGEASGDERPRDRSRDRSVYDMIVSSPPPTNTCIRPLTVPAPPPCPSPPALGCLPSSSWRPRGCLMYLHTVS